MASISVFDVSWSDSSGNVEETASSSSTDTQTLIQNCTQNTASLPLTQANLRAHNATTAAATSLNGSGSADAVRKDDMAKLIANEMNELNSSERDSIYNDLHGISRPEDETEDIVERAVTATRNEIAGVRLKTAYNKALFLNPEYVGSNAFMLMFLRSCKFDPKKTATKIVDHFKYKLDLFGYDNLGRDLMYDDLDKGTRNALASGAVQVLRERDGAGRAVVFYGMDRLRYDTVDSQLRAIWYLMMCTLSDPSVQRNGMVHISYNVQYSSNNFHLDLLLKSSLFSEIMPRKLRGVHFCYDNEALQPVLSMLQMIVGSSARLRFRSHFGSHIQVKSSLQNFGISPVTLPLDGMGRMDCTKIQDFIKERMQVDEERREEMGDRITHPVSKDVLMGRGWHQQEHPGNLELARIVDRNRGEYKSARKLHKTNLNWTIVETIKASGGRFLQRSEPSDDFKGVGWIEASDENARDKVSKCFRTQTKRNSKKAQPKSGTGVANGSDTNRVTPPFVIPPSSDTSVANSAFSNNSIATSAFLNGGISGTVAPSLQMSSALNSAIGNNPLAALQVNHHNSLLNAEIAKNVAAALQMSSVLNPPSVVNGANASNPAASLQLDPALLAGLGQTTVLNSANIGNPATSLQLDPALLSGGISNNVAAQIQLNPSLLNGGLGNNVPPAPSSLQVPAVLNNAISNHNQLSSLQSFLSGQISNNAGTAPQIPSWLLNAAVANSLSASSRTTGSNDSSLSQNENPPSNKKPRIEHV